MDERQIGLDLRAARRRPDPGQASLAQDPCHGAVVHMQLARDRANAPFFDMIIAQDLRLQIGRDGHGVLLGEVWRRIGNDWNTAPACVLSTVWGTASTWPLRSPASPIRQVLTSRQTSCAGRN